jgi:hypothetical protein
MGVEQKTVIPNASATAYGNFRHQQVKVELNSCYDSVIQDNLNHSVPWYKSYITEKELDAINEQSVEDQQRKEALKMALTKNEIDYREYCKELK